MKVLLLLSIITCWYLESQTIPDALPLPNHVVFDLSSLRKPTIAKIRERLGRPNADDKEPDPNDYMMAGRWTKKYHREGLELRIDYEVKTGKIIAIYLDCQRGAIPENSIDKLLVTGHLNSSNKDFNIKPIFVHQDPNTHRYVGLVLTPRS